MPYFTTDLRTALNRAALFMSVGETQHCVILHNCAKGLYAVVDIGLYLANLDRYGLLGYTLAVDLYPANAAEGVALRGMDGLEELLAQSDYVVVTVPAHSKR